MKIAERRLRKLRMGQVPYSRGMNKLGGRIKLWGWVGRLKQGAKINRARIKRLAKGVEVTAPLSLTLKQAQGYLENARKEYLARKAPGSNHQEGGDGRKSISCGK